MKNIPVWKKLALMVIAVAGMNASYAQDKDSAAVIKEMVAQQNYVFKARTMLPMRGPVRQLVTAYDVQVLNDSLSSYLPYFGRAYSAPMSTMESPLDFSSSDFEYSSKAIKKGWQIVIKPKDVQRVQQMTFTIFENGSASLRITNTNRDPISFNGYIEKPVTEKLAARQ